MDDKKYDFLLQDLANPTFNGADFRIIGDMTTENTQFLPFNVYASSPKILSDPRFMDSSGHYDEDLFRLLYYSTLLKYNDFVDLSLVTNYEYDYYDPSRPANAKIRNLGLTFSALSNPLHMTIGIGGFNEVGESELSIRELALRSNIIDSETGRDMGYSPNDISTEKNFSAFIRSITTRLPLVYATYNEDTLEMDPYSGMMVKHFKGEYKINDKGEYYTETLGKLSLLGKDVVSAWDYLTVDGSGLNKYDFFDGDGLTKSTAATIVRSTVAALPIFLPVVGDIYAAGLLAKSVLEFAPMAVGVVEGLMGHKNIETPIADTLAAWGKKFSLSLPDYDRMNMLTLNNIANMAGDLATIFGSLAVLVKGVSKLRGNTDKVMENMYAQSLRAYREAVNKEIALARSGKASYGDLIAKAGGQTERVILKRIADGTWQNTIFGKAAISLYLPKAQLMISRYQHAGENISLVYFAMMLNTELYDSLRLREVDEREAALITLGSMIATFHVDKFMHLGLIFFQRPAHEIELRAVADEFANSVKKRLIKGGTDTTTRKGVLSLVNKGMQTGRNMAARFADGLRNRNLPFAGKAIGEGLMRVSEELVLDLSRSLATLAGNLGIFKENDYGAFEEVASRYGMTFFGGAFGGVLFEGARRLGSIIKNAPDAKDKITKDIIYMVRNGRTDELLDVFNDMYNHGLLGSKYLTRLLLETPNADGSKSYIPAQRVEESLAYQVYQDLVKMVHDIDGILTRNDLKLNKAEQFNRMVLGEYLARQLSLFLKGTGKESAKTASYVTFYYDRLDELTAAIVDKERQIQDMYDAPANTDARQRSQEFKDAINPLKEELKKLLDLKEYMFGEGSLGFVEAMLWAMDARVSGEFLPSNFDSYVFAFTGRDVSELSPGERAMHELIYNQYVATDQKVLLHDAFLKYLDAGKLVIPEIKNLGDVADELARQRAVLKVDPMRRIVKWDQLMDEETDADFKDRDIQRDGESEEAFEARRALRKQLIDSINMSSIDDWAAAMSKEDLTASECRRLFLQILHTFAELADAEYAAKLSDRKLGLPDELRDILLTVLHERGTKRLDRKQRKKIRDAIFNYFYLIRTQFHGSPGAVAIYWGLLPDNSLTFNSAYELVRAKYEELTGEKEIKPMVGPDGKRMSLLDTVKYYMDKLNPALGMPFGRTGQKNLRAAEYIVDRIEGRAARGDDYVFVGKNDITAEANMFTDGVNGSGGIYKGVIDAIENVDRAMDADSRILTARNLVSKKFAEGPIMNILSKVRAQSANNVDIETFLGELYLSFLGSENREQFVLSQELIDTINSYIADLNAIKAYIMAAREPVADDKAMIGHNYAVNDYINNHRNVFPNAELLPTISNDAYQYLMYEIENYIDELGMWCRVSAANNENLNVIFLKCNNAINRMRKDYWTNNVMTFKKIKDNTGIDLLAGIDMSTIGDLPALKDVRELEQKIHENFMAAVGENDAADTLVKILTEAFLGENAMIDINKVALGNTSDFDKDLDYNKLTDYDKAAYFITTLVVDNDAFYRQLLGFMNKNLKLVPLGPLQYVARMIYALRSNRNLINKFLLFVLEKSNVKSQIFWNTAVILSPAGVGKTTFGAASMLAKGDRVWISAPGEELIDRLQYALSNSEVNLVKVAKEELLEKITNKENAEILKNSNSREKDTVYTVNNENGVDGNQRLNINKSFLEHITMLDDKEKPKFIIIDEATWFNTVLVAAISEFAKANDIELIVIGDLILNGTKILGTPASIQREFALAWRTPELGPSLRAAVRLKILNQNALIGIIRGLMRSFPTLDSWKGENAIGSIDQAISKLALCYYQQDDGFYGEKIVKEIDDNILRLLVDKEAALDTGEKFRIGYIGEKDAVYEKLQHHFTEDENLFLVTPEEVLGDEFSYVIINKEWAVNKDWGAGFLPTDTKTYGLAVFDFLKDLYTMTSRSRFGSIIIDNDGIGDVVRTEQMTTTAFIGSLKMSAESFGAEFRREIEALFPSEIEELPSEAESTSETESTSKAKTPTKEDVSNEGASLEEVETPTQEELERAEITGLPENTELDEIDEHQQGNDELNAVPPEYSDGKTDGPPIVSSDAPGAPRTAYGEEQAPTIDVPALAALETASALDAYYEATLDKEYPIRAYSHYMCSGCGMRKVTVNSKKSYYEWIRNGSRRDLDIFMDKDRYGQDDVMKKREIVKLLGKLRSKILYSTSYDEYYDVLPDEITKLFDKDTFKDENMTFLLRSLSIDPENDTNHFVSLNHADNNKRLIGKGKRMVTLVVRLRGKNGLDYYVTLATLANPATWALKKNVANAKTGLEKTINRLLALQKQAELNGNNQEVESLKKLILAKQAYRDAYDDIVSRYTDFIDDFTSMDQEMEIDKPNMNTMTSFYKLKGSPLRLMDLNTRESPFDIRLPNMIKTKPFVIRDLNKFPGLSEKMKGATVMLVSCNTLLNENLLLDLYELQKRALLNGEQISQSVRMVVLTLVGVPFRALYDTQLSDLFKIQGFDATLEKGGKGKNHIYTLPMRLSPMGVRMYLSMWNFRAGLKNFLARYKVWASGTEAFPEKVDDAWVRETCQIENRAFKSAHEQLGHTWDPETHTWSGPLNEAEALRMMRDYRNYDKLSWMDDNALLRLERLWQFNNGNEFGAKLRYFRLGWTADNNNGVYIRELTNVSGCPFYKLYLNEQVDPITLQTTVNHIDGAFIDPVLALTYANFLDALFSEVVTPAIGVPNSVAHTYYMNDSKLILESKVAASKGKSSWFSSALRGGNVKVELFDPGTGEVKDNVEISTTDNYILLAMAMIRVGYSMDLLSKGLHTSKKGLTIVRKIGKLNGKDITQSHTVDLSVLTATLKTTRSDGKESTGFIKFEKNTKDAIYDVPGLVPYHNDRKGNISGVIDRRIDHLFSLMFHGLTSTAVVNEFLHGERLMTGVRFPYGFFTDSIYKAKTWHLKQTGYESNDIIYVANSLICYMSDVVPENPIIGIGLNAIDRYYGIKNRGQLKQIQPDKPLPTAPVESVQNPEVLARKPIYDNLRTQFSKYKILGLNKIINYDKTPEAVAEDLSKKLRTVFSKNIDKTDGLTGKAIIGVTFENGEFRPITLEEYLGNTIKNIRQTSDSNAIIVEYVDGNQETISCEKDIIRRVDTSRTLENNARLNEEVITGSDLLRRNTVPAFTPDIVFADIRRTLHEFGLTEELYKEVYKEMDAISSSDELTLSAGGLLRIVNNIMKAIPVDALNEVLQQNLAKILFEKGNIGCVL